MKLMNESPALSPLLPETCHYPLTPCSANAQIMSFEPISSRYKKKKQTTKWTMNVFIGVLSQEEGSEAMLPPDP